MSNNTSSGQDELSRIFSIFVTNIEHDGSYIPVSAIKAKIPEAKAALLLWSAHHTQEAVEASLDLFAKDMSGYDFTPEDEGEDTNALVANAVRDSKGYVLHKLASTNQPKDKEGE